MPEDKRNRHTGSKPAEKQSRHTGSTPRTSAHSLNDDNLEDSNSNERDPRTPILPTETQAFSQASDHGSTQRPEASYGAGQGTRNTTLINIILQEHNLTPNDWEFLNLRKGDYDACMEHCRQTSAPLKLKPADLKTLAIRLFQEGFDDEAESVVERMIMLNHYLKEDGRDRLKFLRWLVGLGNDGTDFKTKVRSVIDAVKLEAKTAVKKPRDTKPQTTAMPNRPRAPSVSTTKPAMPFQDLTIDSQRQPNRVPNVPRHDLGSHDPSHDPLGFNRPMNWDPSELAETEQSRHDTRSTADPLSPEKDQTGADDDPASLITSLRFSVKDNIAPRSKEIVAEDDFLKGLSTTARKTLDKTYILRKGSRAVEFFVKGRVFSMLWHENAGRSLNKKDPPASKGPEASFRTTLNVKDEHIYSQIRRFVVVKVFDGYVWAIPIYTYRGAGLAKKTKSEKEKLAHAIIYSSGEKPTRIAGEPKFTKDPIKVNTPEGEEPLHPASRLHCGRLTTIDWNIKMKDCGKIEDQSSLRSLRQHLRNELSSDNDTSSDGEGD